MAERNSIEDIAVVYKKQEKNGEIIYLPSTVELIDAEGKIMIGKNKGKSIEEYSQQTKYDNSYGVVLKDKNEIKEGL